MCTYATERIDVVGSVRGVTNWLRVDEATVYYDHPAHAPADHTLNIDFRAPAQGPSARVAVELTAASARELVRAIEAALASAPAGMTV